MANHANNAGLHARILESLERSVLLLGPLRAAMSRDSTAIAYTDRIAAAAVDEIGVSLDNDRIAILLIDLLNETGALRSESDEASRNDDKSERSRDDQQRRRNPLKALAEFARRGAFVYNGETSSTTAELSEVWCDHGEKSRLVLLADAERVAMYERHIEPLVQVVLGESSDD